MRKSWLKIWVLSCLLAGAAGCAGNGGESESASSTEVIPTSRYRKVVSAIRTSAIYGQCYVEFSPVSGPVTAPTLLEEDLLVACNGERTVISGVGYTGYFQHGNSDQVRITIVRPKSGATIVEYHPIQP